MKNGFKLLPIIKGGVSGCLNCGFTKAKLSMRTRLYQDFGGWIITKNKELYYMENPNENKTKTLMHIEIRARIDPNNDWRAELDLPLRSATYQRQGKNKWVLIKKERGFA